MVESAIIDDGGGLNGRVRIVVGRVDEERISVLVVVVDVVDRVVGPVLGPMGASRVIGDVRGAVGVFEHALQTAAGLESFEQVDALADRDIAGCDDGTARDDVSEAADVPLAGDGGRVARGLKAFEHGLGRVGQPLEVLSERIIGVLQIRLITEPIVKLAGEN